MIYELNKCPICGSLNLKQLSKFNNDKNIIIKYKCLACDSIVQNENYLNNKFNDYVDSTMIFKNSLKSIVEIVADFSSISTTGTGILLKNNYVLTNAHILSNGDDFANNIYANFNNDLYNYNLEIISVDDDLDIALLKIYNIKYIPIELENVTVKTGEKVYAIGNAIGQGISIVEGIISDASRDVNGNEYIMHTAPVNHGNSGGPLYNSKGQVIGMIASSRKDAKNMSYAIPNSFIIEYINDIV